MLAFMGTMSFFGLRELQPQATDTTEGCSYCSMLDDQTNQTQNNMKMPVDIDASTFRLTSDATLLHGQDNQHVHSHVTLCVQSRQGELVDQVSDISPRPEAGQLLQFYKK